MDTFEEEEPIDIDAVQGEIDKLEKELTKVRKEMSAKLAQLKMNKTTSNLVIYRSKDGSVQLDVQLDRETLWLSLNQISTLFGRDKSIVSRHLRNVYQKRLKELQQTIKLASEINPPESP
ncbi:MAG: hypothetical protein WC340_08390 [Kiritimatiellia bacterium]